MSINECQTVCDKHSSQCVGFDYFYPTQSCLWRGGSLPDSNDGNKIGTFRKGKCSYAKDFHHALLPTGNNGTCRTIGKKVETIDVAPAPAGLSAEDLAKLNDCYNRISEIIDFLVL